MTAVSSTLSRWIKRPLRNVSTIATDLRYRGTGRFCPVCQQESRRFRSFGLVPRADAQCVYCNALERDRLSWLYLSTRTDLFDGAPKRVLHVAPERSFEPRLRRHLGAGYLTADLLNSQAMIKMDITAIDYPARSFDVIYCSHVLEHVEDDRRAMRELCRVLKDDGWAILLVPITAEKTYEDPSIVEPEERARAFGQADHVRRYGPDYVDRLGEAGFKVDVIRAKDLADEGESIQMGLTQATGEIHHCRKSR